MSARGEAVGNGVNLYINTDIFGQAVLARVWQNPKCVVIAAAGIKLDEKDGKA